MKIKIKKLVEDAITPAYAKYGDAGADLYSLEENVIPSETRVVFGTGIAVEIPYGYVGLVHPRSGLAFKHGVTVMNAPGTIDAGFRGEIKVCLFNSSKESHHVNKGDRIAQLVVQKIESVDFIPVFSLSETERKDSGFGSTGQGDLFVN